MGTKWRLMGTRIDGVRKQQGRGAASGGYAFVRHLRDTPTWSRRHPAHAVLGVVALISAGTWTVKLARLLRSVATYGSYWSESKGIPGGLVYVALGDSAAQGIGASRPERGYVGLLAERIRQRTGREVLLVNLSVSGATVRDVVDVQLAQLQALRADVVTVAIGGNDVPFYDMTRFTSAVDELTAALPAGTFIADVPFYMHGHWERDAVAAGGLLADSARRHQLHVVPLHDAARDRGSRAMLTDFAADLFHPNDRGHRVWADAFWAKVKDSPVLLADVGGPAAGGANRNHPVRDRTSRRPECRPGGASSGIARKLMALLRSPESGGDT